MNVGEFVVNMKVGEYWGRVCFKLIDKDLLETDSRLDGNLQGLGLGIVMYSTGIEYALGEGYRICSSEYLWRTADADRLWKSVRLRRKFVIEEKAGRYWIKGFSPKFNEKILENLTHE